MIRRGSIVSPGGNRVKDSETNNHGAPSLCDNERSVRDLFPVVYEELRDLAHGWSRKGNSIRFLQPTAIVHEAFLRLLKNPDLSWQNKNHFFAIAATAMRHIIHDYVRYQDAGKRGGDWHRISLDESIQIKGPRDIDALALTEALELLEKLKQRHCSIVELRLFGGLEFADIATSLGVSTRTVERDWRAARAWLMAQLKEGIGS
ncbi:MAG: ECF-type sigma factor [Planctomycetota bacterium]|nr:ECF-type sigma factor [Planctomycetota bacterium]